MLFRVNKKGPSSLPPRWLPREFIIMCGMVTKSQAAVFAFPNQLCKHTRHKSTPWSITKTQLAFLFLMVFDITWEMLNKGFLPVAPAVSSLYTQHVSLLMFAFPLFNRLNSNVKKKTSYFAKFWYPPPNKMILMKITKHCLMWWYLYFIPLLSYNHHHDIGSSNSYPWTELSNPTLIQDCVFRLFISPQTYHERLEVKGEKTTCMDLNLFLA